MKYPLFDIYWDQKEINYVRKIITRGSYWAAGPEIQEFESKIADFLGVKYVLTFNSGTSAEHALLLAHGITEGEVIVPSFSFISTVNCVVLAGAEPVFADIETTSMGIDPKDVEKKITERTKAIIPMHYAGRAAQKIKQLRKMADHHDILLIEDNAESFGSKINGSYAGTIGHSAFLSFCQNKVITTGEGGAVCTDDKKVYEKLKLLRSHGRVEEENENYFESINFSDYIDIGYNLRMPTMCAAIGLAQIDKIDDIIALRQEVGNLYNTLLAEIPEVEIIADYPGNKSVYQFYPFLVKNPNNREGLKEYLIKQGIFTKVLFDPIHLKTVFRNKYGGKPGMLPKTEEISERVLALPFSLRFTEEDQRFITSKIAEYFKTHS